MPVSVTAAASAMARPRVRTRVSAAVVVEDTGERGGGDLADAVAGDGAGRRTSPSAAADSSPAATSSGWATAVSRISSASAFVP